MGGLILGLLSLALVATAIVLWMRRLNEVALEGRRGFLFSMCMLGVGVGVAALVREPGWIGGAMALVGIVAGAVWLVLGVFAGQSKQIPNVIVGAPLPTFSAPDHEAKRFEIEGLRGHPVLIKLFRGHW